MTARGERAAQGMSMAEFFRPVLASLPPVHTGACGALSESHRGLSAASTDCPGKCPCHFPPKDRRP